jgi:hypothetical protein
LFQHAGQDVARNVTEARAEEAVQLFDLGTGARWNDDDHHQNRSRKEDSAQHDKESGKQIRQSEDDIDEEGYKNEREE